MSDNDKMCKPLILPNLKPKNPLGLKRKGTIKHKDKRKDNERNKRHEYNHASFLCC